MTTDITCSLCSLPVKINGFTLNSNEGTKKFCCQGCLSIFQLFNENILPPTTNESTNESL